MGPIFKRRADRAQVLELHGLHCILKEQTGHKAPQIANVSTSGIGFVCESLPTWPANGETLEAQISISSLGAATPAEQVFSVRLKIMHQQNGIVGCQFQAPEKAFAKALVQLFDVEFAALRLVKVSAALLKPVDDGTPYWFEGEKNCSLYYVVNAGRLVRFTLSFFGNCVQAGEGQPLRFGEQVLDPNKVDRAYDSRTTYRWEDSWPREMLRLAERFLDTVPTMAEGEKEQIRSWLKKIPVRDM
jgi:hypothetical protein